MRNSGWLLRGLHVVLGLALPLLVIALTSCKRAKEETAELGPEVSSEAVVQALDDASSGWSFNDITQNQFIEYSFLQRVEGNESTTLLGTMRVGVRLIEETDTQKKIIFSVTRLNRNADGGFDPPTVTETEPWVIQKPAGGAQASAKSMGAMKLKELKAYVAKVSGRADDQGKTTFHNLRVVDGSLEAPAAVQNKPGCGGLPDCSLPVRYVRFEIAAWNKEGTSYQRIALDFAISRVTPFMPLGEDVFDFLNGLIVVDCRSTRMPVNGKHYYVRECKQVENYQK